jgi:hypothetical protein
LYAEDTGYKEIDLVISREIPEELQMTLQGSDEDSPHIEFFPRGSSTGGVIEITSDRGAEFFISINKITGKLEVGKAE